MKSKNKLTVLIIVLAVAAVGLVGAIIGVSKIDSAPTADSTDPDAAVSAAADGTPTEAAAIQAFDEIVTGVQDGTVDIQTVWADSENTDPDVAAIPDSFVDYFKNTVKPRYNRHKTLVVAQDEHTFMIYRYDYTANEANETVDMRRDYAYWSLRYNDGAWQLFYDETIAEKLQTIYANNASAALQTALKQLSNGETYLDIYENETDRFLWHDPTVPLFHNEAVYDGVNSVHPVAVFETEDLLITLLYLSNGTSSTTTFGEYRDYFDDRTNRLTMFSPENETVDADGYRCLYTSINTNVPAGSGIYYTVSTDKSCFLPEYQSLADWPEDFSIFFEKNQ